MYHLQSMHWTTAQLVAFISQDFLRYESSTLILYKELSSTIFEVGAQIFFRQKKWQFFHQKWWFSRWITENGDNIGEGTGDIFSDCWKSWNSCHNYCHLFWWQYCHQIWWRFFHRKWWLSKWITVKGEKSGERKGDVLGEC